MEGGVPRVEEADSEPKNFHLSKQAGESHRNSESNSMKAPLYSQGREAETPRAASGPKTKLTKAHRGSSILIMSWSEDENTLIVCPATHKH